MPCYIRMQINSYSVLSPTTRKGKRETKAEAKREKKGRKEGNKIKLRMERYKKDDIEKGELKSRRERMSNIISSEM